MLTRQIEAMASRMAEARSICRAFSTYSPQQQIATAPATSNSRNSVPFQVLKAH